MQDLGAGLVDCDKLGHAAYLPGSPTLQKLVQEFGSSVLSGKLSKFKSLFLKKHLDSRFFVEYSFR